MFTLWCLTVAFCTPWLAGAPLLWLVRGARPLRRPDWLWVPFVGLAALVCALQNAVVFGDVPLRIATPWAWITVAALWVPMLATARGRASLRTIPVRVILGALAVYLAQCAGVLANGVERFRGNLMTDQYPYVALAQLLTDEPFSTGWADVGQRAWLVLPLALKADRLGQSVLHGFFAASAGTDTLNLFFPTIALSAALLVPAVRLFAPAVGLFGRRATVASVLCALVPGATAILADCYLSHALFVPVLFAFLAAVSRAGRSWFALVSAALAFALGFSVYTEFAPLMIGAGGLALVVGKPSGGIGWKRALAVVALLCAGPLLNPAAVSAAKEVVGRGQQLGKQIDTNLTWAQIPAHVWLDRLRATATPSAPTLAVRIAFVGGCFALALLGWSGAARRARRFARTRPAVVAVVALLVLPLAALPNDARYAAYKVFLTTAPLFVLGMLLWARARKWRGALVGGLAVVLVLVSVSEHLGRVSRANQAARDAWNSPESVALEAFLRNEPPTDVIVAVGNDFEAPVFAAAVMYHGRHHRVRLASPQKMWVEPLSAFPAPQIAAPSEPPPGALVIATATGEPLAAVPGEVLQRGDRYVLVRVSGGPGRAYATGSR